MIICTKCKEIYGSTISLKSNDYCPKNNCSGQLADIDENMVVICKKFWDKGYNTKFCCEGHYDSYGSSPYIWFTFNKDKVDIPWPDEVEIPSESYPIDGYYPLIHATKLYVPSHDIFGLDVDIDDALNGKFKTPEHENLWNKYSDTIKAILELPMCKNLNDKSIQSFNITLFHSEYGEVPYIRIEIYFKCMLEVLEGMHPDLEASDSEFLRLRDEQELLIIFMQFKLHYIRFLLEEYIPKLPDITNSKGLDKPTLKELGMFAKYTDLQYKSFSEYEDIFKRWLN